MIPARYEHLVFSLILSTLMSGIISCVVMLRTLGVEGASFSIWLTSWLNAWVIAYPAVLIVGPMARRFTHRIIKRA